MVRARAIAMFRRREWSVRQIRGRASTPHAALSRVPCRNWGCWSIFRKSGHRFSV